MAASLQEMFAAHRFTPAQRRIAGYLVANAEDAAYLTSTELAERAEVSQPSVTRFVALLGFDGYGAFRRHLRRSASTPPATHSTKFQEGLDEDLRNVAALRARLADDQPLREIGRRLAESDPLVVMGFRVSAAPAALFGYLAAKIHPDVQVLSGGGSVLGDQLRHASRRGARVAILFALPRYPREAQEALVQARELGLRTVLLTDKPVSALTPDADDVLSAGVASEFVFDSHAAVMSLSAALLEAMTDAAGARARQRLESFEEYAAQRELFLPD
ncbi:MurR/RpiR family transcriptional regulator [Amycolatopsis sp. H20-H5]|uniref:MurR/RpiR family transcriptional regulator n=1 Tax=Amycolatopsis sp. H20-H5 TaxID=3046309 RepID=UPI002DB9FED0|nr:MurR/RpiR family transcriptional regulator [Amycolatopsis sp. H20-H5]MEC3977350.1 MurR/RpiR family transcriptional regulator [Amycolatopsis sp. H20-H5]